MKNNKLKKQAEYYVEEYLKCSGDFKYYCTNYVKIEIAGDNCLFTPYDKQLEFIQFLEQYKHLIVCKSRQLGFSTVLQIYLSWVFVFNTNITAGIISKDGAAATAFSRSIAAIIDKLPIWMRPKFKKRNEQYFELSNGCKCISSVVNPIRPNATLRSYALNFLICDEIAFCPYIDKAMVGIIPALATAQKRCREMKVPYGTILVSTPNGTVGLGKYFYEMYSNAVSNTDDSIFKPFTVSYKDIPQLNDPEWINSQKQMFKTEAEFLQEMDLQFIAAEGSFYRQETVQKLQENTNNIEPINKYKIFNGEVWIFEESQPNKIYIIGVDTASEHGKDKSTIQIFDYETLDQVAEYQGKCQVTDFCRLVYGLCSQYKNGTVVIENNSYGNQVSEYMSNSDLNYMVYKGHVTDSVIKYGLSNNPKTRPLIIDALYTYVNDFPTTIKSKRLVLELIGLETKKSGKVEASLGDNDDLALAASFCYYVRKYDPPMLLNKNSEAYNTLYDIMDLNNDNLNNQYDSNILYKIKNEYFNDYKNKNIKEPYIDIFKYMNK